MGSSIVKTTDLRRLRLTHQGIAVARAKTPAAVVASLGAMQAQDYAGGLWAIGLRLPDCSIADVQRAIAPRSIVRTWPLRGTLHFVAAEDVAWMLTLLGPRTIAASVARQAARGLNAAVFRKVEKVLVPELEGGRQLTRDAIRALLERAQISTADGRLYHCLWRLALEQVLCCGAPEGKQQTFALLGDWLPPTKPLQPEEALVRLATRYFDGHGPATLQDLMRWARLTSAEAKRAIAGAGKRLATVESAGRTYFMSAERRAEPAAARGAFLLPAFDEYLLGYKDRSAILDDEHAAAIFPGGGVFRSTLVHDGRVIGSWKASATKQRVRIVPAPFGELTPAQHRALAIAATRYGAFLGRAALVDR
jgi:hypothetical protein